MADEHFEVVFEGRTAAGADPAQVRANVARLFKTDTARIEHLFSGQRVVIKKGLDESTARNYQAALAKAGAIVDVVQAGAAVAPAAPSVPAAPSAGPASVKSAGPPQAPDYSIAEPGVLLVEPVTVPAATIDVSHLSMAEAGVVLVEPVPIAAPRFDLSGLKLDPPGTVLVEPKPVPPADYDTSALTLAER